MKNYYLKTLLLFAVLLSVGTINAQWQNGLWTGKQAYNWYFPIEAGLNFNTSPPTPLTDGRMTANPNGDPGIEAAATISDANGNLLFYTNGVTVWNKNHQVMQNGEGLLGDASSGRGAVIVPKPGNPGIYYIFTTRQGSGKFDPTPEVNQHVIDVEGSVRYSEVDLTLDGGLGAVTSNKNIVILFQRVGWDDDDNIKELVYRSNEERLTAVHHANGENVWLTARQDNTYFTFLISSGGVATTPIISTVGVGTYALQMPGIDMKFSPDGTKLAVVNPQNAYMIVGTNENGVPIYEQREYPIEIFNFDNNTGEFTGPIISIGNEIVTHVERDGYSGPDGYGVNSLEFSPNGKYFYIVTSLTSRVYQFDLSLGNQQDIIDSATLLYETFDTPFSNMVQLQNGPDGKIYMSDTRYFYETSNTALHVIEYPNNKGLAAGFDANGLVDLAGKESGIGLPNFITSYFESGILHEGECATHDVTFSTLRIPGIQSIVWDFGDPASGADNASTDLEPAHTYQNPGIYIVTAIITSNGAQQTATTTVTIVPAPVAVPPQGATLVQCADANGNAIFNLNQFSNTLLAGQDADAFTVAYYASGADLQANIPIVNAANFTTTGQTVYTQVVNNTTGCYTNTSFTLVVNPMPVATAPDNIQVCANTTGEAVFNLTQQNAVILGNQDPALFTVTFYANEQDVQNNNPVATPDAFSSTSQNIYAVVNNNITGCTDNTQFEVVALQSPVLPEVIEYTGCSPFDLTTITAQQSQGSTLTFYANENDAVAGTNAITDSERYIVPDNDATIYIVATNAQGCEDTGTLTLNAGNCTIPRGISPNNDGFNDRFDLSGFDVEQLSIFNRYGAEVFSLANYTDQWHGQSDNNNDLPTGTYYYSIQTNTGEQKTGWVYINREVN